MSSVLSEPHFHNEEAAYAYVEARLWADGRVCPHCGVVDHSSPMKGRTTRPGLYKCYACRKPFTVKIGTIFESSHVKLHIWLQGIHLMCASKKGISTRQLQRMMGCGLKTAWFLGHRIREAMDDGYVHPAGQMGGSGKTVEADESFIGPNPQKDTRVRVSGIGAREHLMNIYSLVERGGSVRSFVVKKADALTLTGIMADQVDRHSRVNTDEHAAYRPVRKIFLGGHGTVNHSQREYVRGRDHTNTVENFFSVFKRGHFGVYQHMSGAHLKRYLAEFDFRYSNRAKLGIDDVARADLALQGAKGKRLTYRTVGGSRPA